MDWIERMVDLLSKHGAALVGCGLLFVLIWRKAAQDAARETRILDAIIGDRHDDEAPNLRSLSTQIADVAVVAHRADAKAEEAVARVAAVERDIAGIKRRPGLKAVDEVRP